MVTSEARNCAPTLAAAGGLITAGCSGTIVDSLSMRSHAARTPASRRRRRRGVALGGLWLLPAAFACSRAGPPLAGGRSGDAGSAVVALDPGRKDMHRL